MFGLTPFGGQFAAQKSSPKGSPQGDPTAEDSSLVSAESPFRQPGPALLLPLQAFPPTILVTSIMSALAENGAAPDIEVL